jgi:hypothetical protein
VARNNRRMSRDADPITLFDVVRRAVEAADPDLSDPNLGDFLKEFEDSREPVSGVDQLDEVLAEAELDLDADGDDPEVALAVAIARYLAHHRGALGEDDEALREQAIKWQWHDHPPAGVVALFGS